MENISSFHKTSNVERLVEMASGNMPVDLLLEKEQRIEGEQGLESLER